ncbi:hypothetical protein BP5796_04804 [Coleophoma crateriformis]|uniref:Flavin reductase like domain-containing protein n=1 Tax=Coleophoma crateriformis TaxID=565419 RepID=A0A3D8SAM3_9HELO|nr:hypothetical protein BP5796_04804 [Coleophoma crateriformis]
MRKLPHSVVVLTTAQQPTSSAPQPIRRGMTLSSFTTLTLTPNPIVTFNIRRPSLTLSALRSSPSHRFNIQVLNANPLGAQIADAFTRGNKDGDPFQALMQRQADSLEIVEQEGAGLMFRSEGVKRTLGCKILGQGKGFVDVGDHVVVMAEVVDIYEPFGDAGMDNGSLGVRGLAYVDGGYI